MENHRQHIAHIFNFINRINEFAINGYVRSIKPYDHRRAVCDAGSADGCQ
jgi:hypothetical protein